MVRWFQHLVTFTFCSNTHTHTQTSDAGRLPLWKWTRRCTVKIYRFCNQGLLQQTKDSQCNRKWRIVCKKCNKKFKVFFVDPNPLKNLTSKRENFNSTVQNQYLYVHYYKTVHAVKIYICSMPLMHSTYLLLVKCEHDLGWITCMFCDYQRI